MHISIFVYGSWGDLRPHVVLGVALKQAGHDVQVIAARVYEDWVRARGLDYYPLSADLNTVLKDNASIMEEGFLKQIQVARNYLPPVMTQMGVETLDATRESDVLMTVEFGVPLLFDVLQANNLKTILINPAPLNPTAEFPSAAVPPRPGWFPFADWYTRMSYVLVHRMQ